MLGATGIEGLLRFAETVALQRDPVATYTTRLVLLRLVFSLAKRDIAAVLQQLDGAGVAVGTYDTGVSHLYHDKGLTHLLTDDWVALYQHLTHAAAEDMTATLQARHGENVQRSAMWRIKSTLAVALHTEPDTALVFTVFFALYNSEVDRGALLRLVLQEHGVPQSMDVALELMSRCLGGATDDFYLADVVLVLEQTWIDESGSAGFAFLHSETLALDMSSAAQKVAARHGTARPSLLLLRQVGYTTARAGAGAGAADLGRPRDFPLDSAVWADLSAGQRNSLIFVGMTTAHHDPAQIGDLASAIQPRLALDLRNYTAHPSQHKRAVPSLLSLLERSAAVIDTQTPSANSVLRPFASEIAAGIFSDTVTDQFTLSFLLQLYLIAYLAASVQAELYQSLATTLNARVALANENRDIVPRLLPPALHERFARWANAHRLDKDLCCAVFRRVCA